MKLSTGMLRLQQAYSSAVRPCVALAQHPLVRVSGCAARHLLLLLLLLLLPCAVLHLVMFCPSSGSMTPRTPLWQATWSAQVGMCGTTDCSGHQQHSASDVCIVYAPLTRST
jgi:hypothetical protein